MKLSVECARDMSDTTGGGQSEADHYANKDFQSAGAELFEEMTRQDGERQNGTFLLVTKKLLKEERENGRGRDNRREVTT